jgi:CHAT domain-containing protein/tetratricopeptide (TPR) repeat protein
MLHRAGFTLLILLAASRAAAQTPPRPDLPDREILPQPTKEGVAALQHLMKLCVEGGAVQFLPRSESGPARVVLVDGARLGAILRQQRAQLTPALCDTLLTTSLSVDQAVLLNAVAELNQEPRLLAFASRFLGESMERDGNFPDAVRRYADATRRFAVLGLPGWQASTLDRWADVLSQQGDHDAARQRTTEALRVLEAAHGRVSLEVATCLIRLGSMEREAGRLQEAEARLQEALGILGKFSEEPVAVYISVHRSLGDVRLDAGDGEGGLRHFEAALRFARKLPDGPDRAVTVASALSNLGTANSQLRRHEKGLEYYREALALLETDAPGHDDRRAAILDNLGTSYLEMGRRKECIDALERSLRLRLNLYGERSWDVVASYRQIGAAQLHFGAYRESRQAFQEMRRIAELLGGVTHPLVGDALGGLASVALEQGDLLRARELAQADLAIRQRHAASQPGALAECRNSLGQIHHKLGQDGRATDDFRAALALWEMLHGPNHPFVAAAWQNLGSVRRGQHDFEGAAVALGKALAIREQAVPRDDEEVAQSLNSLGSLHYDRGEYGRALEFHRRAWKLLLARPQTTGTLRAGTLSNIGMSQYGLRQWADAASTFDDALGLLRVRPRVANPVPESSQALYGFGPDDLIPARLTAQVLYFRGMALHHRTDEAPTRKGWSETAFSFLSAILILEQLKAQVLETEESRSELGQGFGDLYPVLIGCYLRQRALTDSTPQARPMVDDLIFRTAELGSARAFLLTLARSRADLLGGVPPAEQARQLDLVRALRTAENELQRVQSPLGLERDFNEVNRLAGVRKRCAAQLDDWRRDAERRYPGFVDWETPRPCPLADARRTLSADEVGLIYVTGSAESYVIVVEPRVSDRSETDPLPVFALPKAGLIGEWVESLLHRTRQANFPPEELLREGYEMLVTPVADRIRGKNLVIVPMGELCYLPFELLARAEDGAEGGIRYLIEDCRVRYAPSLGSLRLIGEWREKRDPPERTLWALGDPVYDIHDERAAGRDAVAVAHLAADVPDDTPTFARLIYSGQEVEGIGRALGARDAELHTGLGASEATVKDASESGRLAHYRYVHFATHGVLGVTDGRQPGLVLSLVASRGATGAPGVEDGFLGLDEIMRLKLNADAVVLSACDSGRGRLHDGEGVRGLARGILHAGSRSVVCSLWKVDDRVTMDLMVALYSALKRGKTTAEAVREAKLNLLRDGRPPFQWAPFIVIGE